MGLSFCVKRARRLLEIEFDTGEGASSLVPPELADEIIAGSRADSPQLTLASLALSTFSNARVEQVVVDSLGLR